MPYAPLPLSSRKAKITHTLRKRASLKSGKPLSHVPKIISAADVLKEMELEGEDASYSASSKAQQASSLHTVKLPCGQTPPTPKILPPHPQSSNLQHPVPITHVDAEISGAYLSGIIDTLNASATITIVDPITEERPVKHTIHLYSNSSSTVTQLASLALMPGDVVVVNNVKKADTREIRKRKKGGDYCREWR